MNTIKPNFFFQKRMAAIWILLQIIAATGADLLDRSTAIQPSKDKCFLLQAPETAQLIIEPRVLLNELLALRDWERITKKKINERSKNETDMLAIEQILINSLHQEPNVLDELITKQHRLIKMLTQGVYQTTNDPYITVSPNKLELLEIIPKITTEFSTGTRFDNEFVNSQNLRLDEQITDATRKLPKEVTEKILTQNFDTFRIQFESTFNKKYPKHVKIGFSDTTTPKNFAEFFKDIVNASEWRKLLTLIKFIKSNILFQMQQRLNPNLDRDNQWFETIATQASNHKTLQYKNNAANTKRVMTHHQRPALRTRRHPLVMLAGKALITLFSGQAQRLAVKAITKLTTNTKLKKAQSRMIVSARNNTPKTANLPDLITTAIDNKDQLRRLWAKLRGKSDYYEKLDQRINEAKLLAKLANTNLRLLRDSMIYMRNHSHKIEHMKHIQELQFEYANSVFTQTLPINLLDSLQGTPLTNCRVSVTLIENKFTIRYNYHSEVNQIPTFTIRTTPFLIGDRAFSLSLPAEISLLEDGKFVIPNPRSTCGYKCHCDENTVKQKIDPCFEQILKDKFAGNVKIDIEKCRNYLMPTNNQQTAIRFKQDHYTVFTPTHTKAEISCGKNREQTNMKPGINRIEIPYGCKMQTDKLYIQNHHIPAETIPLIHENDLTGDKKRLANNSEDNLGSLIQGIKRLNYSEYGNVDTALIKSVADMKKMIKLMNEQEVNITHHAITAAVSITTTLILTIILSQIKGRILGGCRKNVLICGCCCAVRPEDSTNAILNHAKQEEEAPLQEDKPVHYPDLDLYASNNSITSRERPKPTPRSGCK